MTTASIHTPGIIGSIGKEKIKKLNNYKNTLYKNVHYWGKLPDRYKENSQITF